MAYSSNNLPDLQDMLSVNLNLDDLYAVLLDITRRLEDIERDIGVLKNAS